MAVIYKNRLIPDTTRLQAHEVVPEFIQGVEGLDDYARRCEFPWKCECMSCACEWNDAPIRAAQRSRYGQRHRRVRRITQKIKHG